MQQKADCRTEQDKIKSCLLCWFSYFYFYNLFCPIRMVLEKSCKKAQFNEGNPKERIESFSSLCLHIIIHFYADFTDFSSIMNGFQLPFSHLHSILIHPEVKHHFKFCLKFYPSYIFQINKEKCSDDKTFFPSSWTMEKLAQNKTLKKNKIHDMY